MHIIFSCKESFFYIRAHERASFHLKDHAASIFYITFSQTRNPPNPEKEPIPRNPPVSLILSLLHRRLETRFIVFLETMSIGRCRLLDENARRANNFITNSAVERENSQI